MTDSIPNLKTPGRVPQGKWPERPCISCNKAVEGSLSSLPTCETCIDHPDYMSDEESSDEEDDVEHKVWVASITYHSDDYKRPDGYTDSNVFSTEEKAEVYLAKTLSTILNEHLEENETDMDDILMGDRNHFTSNGECVQLREPAMLDWELVKTLLQKYVTKEDGGPLHDAEIEEQTVDEE